MSDLEKNESKAEETSPEDVLINRKSELGLSWKDSVKQVCICAIYLCSDKPKTEIRLQLVVSPTLWSSNRESICLSVRFCYRNSKSLEVILSWIMSKLPG